MSTYCSVYFRKGQIFIPTVSITDTRLYIETEPVVVLPATDAAGIAAAIEAAVARGNPTIPHPLTPKSFPVPVLLAYAKVKTWASFEKLATNWSIRVQDGNFRLEPMRKLRPRGFEPDPEKYEDHSSAQSVARRIVELAAQLG
jgi:hypothetical protein